MAVTQQRREQILAAFEAVGQRISAACETAGRPRSSVTLLPVTKFHSVDDIMVLHELGERRFGENLVQEIETKAAEFTARGIDDIEWVAIGHLQSNKARLVAELAAEFQALDSLKLARNLDGRLRASGRTLDVLVQVNSSGEPTKFGFEPAQVVDFSEELQAFDSLRPRGLMTLALNSSDQDAVGRCFDTMVELQAALKERSGLAWDVLSMGMSGDLDLAIARGATEVRVGQAIFGAR